MIASLSLLDNHGDVHAQAGLNWGYSAGHTCSNDAYIPIKKRTIRDFPNLFPRKSNNPLNNIIDVEWDDGVMMTLLLEGTQEVNDIIYAKQMSTYDDKSKLGDYIRDRINVHNRPVSLEDLQIYGRTSITVTQTGYGSYFFDFSV